MVTKQDCMYYDWGDTAPREYGAFCKKTRSCLHKNDCENCNSYLKRSEAHTKARVEQAELIDKLVADKDEQAGTIMRLDNGLKKLRSSLQWLKETIHDLDYKAWAEDNIGKIDALLGGAEDERADSKRAVDRPDS